MWETAQAVDRGGSRPVISPTKKKENENKIYPQPRRGGCSSEVVSDKGVRVRLELANNVDCHGWMLCSFLVQRERAHSKRCFHHLWDGSWVSHWVCVWGVCGVGALGTVSLNGNGLG